MTLSGMYNGYLDIKGSNPKITDVTTLANIDILVDRGWTVLYNISDIIVPVITLIGNSIIYHEAKTTYNDTGATASDDIDGDITENIIVTSNVNSNVLGTYHISYNVQDSSGNDAIEVVRTVIVQDTIIPVITLTGGATINLFTGDIYTELGATALDNYDGDITNNIVITGTIDTNTIGSYIKYYNVIDSSGNVAIQRLRTINIVNLPDEITIGTQTWKTRNLNINDGLEGIYSYDNNSANSEIYGYLYTWAAATRVVATIPGWHIPSDSEWTTLSNNLGGNSVSGGILKEAGLNHWNSPNLGATNEILFTALPSGVNGDSGFDGIGGSTSFWASQYYGSRIWYRRLSAHNKILYRGWYYNEWYLSVRLIKE